MAAMRQIGNKDAASGWAKNGSFMNKPDEGWIHGDEDVGSSGVCYSVRYIGCVEVKVSARTLDFDTRTELVRECIHRVCEAAGLKTSAKKRKINKKIAKYLGEHPNMIYAGANVNLLISTESLQLTVMETAEMFANHHMTGISFASGGDADTMDFVAYVAKDSRNGRACHVLECGGRLAQEVITTIGQAFELRFKSYLQNQPKPVPVPDRLENPVFADREHSAWGEDPVYYNDRPGAVPPPPSGLPPPVPPLPQYKGPQTIGEDTLNGNSSNSIFYDNPREDEGAAGGFDDKNGDLLHDDPLFVGLPDLDDNRSNSDNNRLPHLDPFDMQPFCNSLPVEPPETTMKDRQALYLEPANEIWYHGPLNRKQAEELLQQDGEFLVRASTNSQGQFVLSGINNGKVKHLLLVDPDGKVRTKDKEFESVSHLINFHRDNSIPIVSQDSELILRTPVIP